MSPLSDLPALWVVGFQMGLYALRALAERLRRQVAEAALGTTCSIGVAQAHWQDIDAGQLIARADAALYRAKDAGRDRVEAA